MLRRFVGALLRPLYGFIIRYVPIPDPWERLTVTPRLYNYGSGLRFDFDHYMHGESLVQVTSLEELQQWLVECRYESDEVLFNEADFWQHPNTFERLRAGDCEDFAIWAWRKLRELGYDADLVAGYCVKDNDLDGRHAWVMFRRDGQEFVFEPGFRSKDRMIRPLAEVKDQYIPQVGVDRNGRKFAFAGFLAAQKKLLQKSPAARATA